MPFNRTLFFCLFVCILLSGTNSFAGDASVRPVSSLSANFLNTIRTIDANFAFHETKNMSGAKICSCQILNMQSANYQHQNIAVFAEKTNHGNFSAGYKATKAAIEKEKKHLKNFFYDKVKVVNEVQQVSDCKSLYIKLKGVDKSLVMYDILDADIRK